MVTASICTIGDEILIGQIVDTNSSKIATALNSIGVQVHSMVSTSDRENDIISTIEQIKNFRHSEVPDSIKNHTKLYLNLINIYLLKNP